MLLSVSVQVFVFRSVMFTVVCFALSVTVVVPFWKTEPDGGEMT